jgi:hypothetical protein
LLPVLQDADAVGASVRDFCERARARLENCHDFESKRQFLADYVARVVYTRYKVTLRGSVPLRPLADRDQPSMASALEFRIEGEIKGAAMMDMAIRMNLRSRPKSTLRFQCQTLKCR